MAITIMAEADEKIQAGSRLYLSYRPDGCLPLAIIDDTKCNGSCLALSSAKRGSVFMAVLTGGDDLVTEKAVSKLKLEIDVLRCVIETKKKELQELIGG